MSTWSIPLEAEPEWRSLDDLTANPANWRVHSAEQEAALRQMLERVGVVERPLVSKKTGVMLDGHLRVKMARSAGEEGMWVDVADVTPEQERIILATLDSLAELAEGTPPPSPAADLLRAQQRERTETMREWVGVGEPGEAVEVEAGERAEIISVEDYACIWVRVPRGSDLAGVEEVLAATCEALPGVKLTGGDFS